MEELDEIEALEAAGQKLMQEPTQPSRKRGHAGGGRAGGSRAGGSPASATKKATPGAIESEPSAQEGSANVENLLVEIRDRLDLLLQSQDHGQDGSSDAPPEGQKPGPVTPEPAASSPIPEEPDEFRKVFPHGEVEVVAPPTAPPVTTAPAPIIDTAQLLSSVEDQVTRHALTHHSSVVILLGWAMALLSAGIGMGYGYITASGRYPFWWPAAKAGALSKIAAAWLGAPVGVVLLPIAGAILWTASKDTDSEKHQVILRMGAILAFLAGILLPVVSWL